MLISPNEQNLCKLLRDHPANFNHRYDSNARRALVQILFQSLAGGRDDYLSYFFPQGPPPASQPWSLRTAQGAVEGAEYTEAARGHPCGHIFKSGEATYRCKTCTVDDTCVLCARCFDASDHEGHTVFVSISPGNSGCCDCGDDEAWLRPVHCNIHSKRAEADSKAAGKARQGSLLPEVLVESIRITIARTLDYYCDVFSCSPEQLRLPKTEQTILKDERLSRLTSKWYGGADEEPLNHEFALVLWNDEKHTVNDVRDQVSRACKQRKKFGLEKALEVDEVGRSVVTYSTDVEELLRIAEIIEQIKLTVTIRSARDTFREQMCGTIMEWITDIAGCSAGPDHNVLRNVICEEMLKPWRMGSEAHHAQVGKDGIDDHEVEDDEELPFYGRFVGRPERRARRGAQAGVEQVGDSSDDDSYSEAEDGNEMDVDQANGADQDGDYEMRLRDDSEDYTEAQEATLAGYPPPPPPPPPPAPRRRGRGHTPPDSDDGDHPALQVALPEPMKVPRTPKRRVKVTRPPKAPKYWLETPEAFSMKEAAPVHEDLWQRVRLDYMILYDLRMWKKARIDMRDVFITTVVTIPSFKRVLGLRFAGVYTTLAQLYLIADREPDHSIINLSLQMLTTPSITAEVIERGNFFTNLMAILYTFLTTRQVGYPSDVNPLATLAFDAGAVTNRRMYHFFLDMKYLLSSDQVQEQLCNEERYLLQFLDLVKLHQGICPNVRAVGEHLEYETDAWISAQIITREINKLCRQFSEAYSSTSDPDFARLCKAIRRTAKVVIINSLGAERRRFSQAEIKQETRFKKLDPFVFEIDLRNFSKPQHIIVDFIIEKEPMSFHHALHYTLSWLIDRGKGMARDQMLALLLFSVQELREAPAPLRALTPDLNPDQYLLAAFDFPLRVCAWLSQMRAGMWVRNGITLRHQMSTYRGVIQRDVAYQRDIFLLQAAMVLCSPAAFLASVVDRFGLLEWVTGSFTVRPGWEDTQTIDVAEDFIHLLIVLLSDRASLVPSENDGKPQINAIRRDIAHILCFKPLSHSELTQRLSEKIQEADEFADILSEMTKFRPPEGLSDSGTFELKEQFVEEIDPYNAQYTRNQREEAENIYKKYMAKKTGRPPAEIVFEPRLHPISSGVFQSLADFTKIPLFAQVIYYFLKYVGHAPEIAPNVPTSRIEGFLQFVLQLVLLAVNEDDSDEDHLSEGPAQSFVSFVLLKRLPNVHIGQATILSLLQNILRAQIYSGCEPKIRLILHRLQQKQPSTYAAATSTLDLPGDRMDTASPAPPDAQEKELKKRQALERQARVMAAMKEQQSNFMANQAVDWGDEDYSDADEDTAVSPTDQHQTWKFPSGTCILCQEETDDQRLYGTFAFITESSILRQTNIQDRDWVAEVVSTPMSLDRSAESIRPFGVAGQNRRRVEKVTSDGTKIITERQDLGKGFPHGHIRRGPITTGCGHIMHYACFENYNQATQRRHINQIARNHPERPDAKEFLCPLCKALGNVFLPIIWKDKTLGYPDAVAPEVPFEQWIVGQLPVHVSKLYKGPEKLESHETPAAVARSQKFFLDYASQEVVTSLASGFPDLTGIVPLIMPPSQPPRSNVQLLPAVLPLAYDDPRDPLFFPEQSLPSVSLPMLELTRIYQRLRDTMRVNSLYTRYSYTHTPSAIVEDLTHTDTLARTLGFSIASTEIAQRGVECDVGTTLLDKIPSSTLTHLRILSETILSYNAVGCLRNDGSNKTNQEFLETQIRQLRQLFIGHPYLYERDALELELRGLPPLLEQDPFVFLTECAVCIVPVMHLDIHHILRLCYLAEIIRVIVTFVAQPKSVWPFGSSAATAQGNSKLTYEQKSQCAPEQALAFRAFLDRIVNTYLREGPFTSAEDGTGVALELADSLSSESWPPSPLKPTYATSLNPVHIRRRLEQPECWRFLRTLITSYALPFLRKAVILMHVRFGVDFPFAGPGSANDSELDRLSRALQLPLLDQIFESYMSDEAHGSTTRSLVTGWIRHWTWSRDVKQRPPRPGITLSHPAIFELVGLPKNYDTLTDEAIKRKCPTTGKDITDPAVCLFCGDIFCSQAVCCSTLRGTLTMGKGGCNRHMAKCGVNVGLFINIRKCMVLYLHNGHGSWSVAPYLDKHGESDPTLRRHHQLFLNQKRYDQLLRNVWLNHGIPSTIARRLEGDVNNGGWETL
ncbi:hypothetical protein W97_04751 [Coniosporium apollinis CBS 100218]|uniref:E3 ubiquitin-protein ligase n=1 Tax=Coniosporium apollinis (strain CBS 100218) TaxID=1168221 RepID=R7YUI7_CONA1|nr:uncharacterized protein W97_04751 [Coniosporium apollinis CBS 100218]EON65513.1 hypothetical protein W97_04751 [Coniosporium apollinis CBS 100218]